MIADNPLNAFARGRERDSNGAKLGYPTHYVVDGGKARVILDVLVTPAEVTENLPMLDLLFRSRFRWDLHPRSVTADAAYGTTQNIAAVEKAGICAYLAVVDHEKRTSSLFGRDAFTYDAHKDIYTCPKGEILVRRGYDYRERSIRYAARACACNACALKAGCTKSTKGRWIRRSFDEEYLERARAYRDTEPYLKAMRKRAVWVEPLFGEAKDWHGLRRFRLRRLEKVNTEALLKAAGQNVKRLLAFGARGPKGPAQVAALSHPAANPFEFRSVRRHRKRCSRHPTSVFQHAGRLAEVQLRGISLLRGSVNRVRSKQGASCTSAAALAYDLAVFRTRRLQEDLPVERVRSRVSAYIYGNIFVLAAIFATSPESVAHWSAVVIVVATSATTFFAHVVAHNVGQAIGRPDDEGLRAQLAREARDAVPIMTSGTVPAVLLGLGALGWLPTGLSQVLAEAYVVVRLAGTGIVVRRLSAEASGRGGFWSGLALAGIGIVIAALKQILTH